VVGAAQSIVASAGIVENNLVANTNGDGLRPGTASICSNTFIGVEGNGVYLDNVPAAFEFNNFEFNLGSFDVYVDVPNSVITDLPAQYNWWGTTDTDLIKTRTRDFYDEYYLAKLLTAPVLEQPSQTAPGYVRSVTLDPDSPVGIQTVNFTVEYSRPMYVSTYPHLTAYPQGVNAWTTRTSMPSPRFGLGTTLSNSGLIFAVGGWYEGFSSAVEAYDPNTDTWTIKMPMPTARRFLGVATANNGKIYAIGGEGGETVLEEYDPLANTWTTRTPMPTGRYALGVAAVNNGKIYAIGGSGGENVVEEYDPITNTWTTKTPMPTGRSYLGVAAASNGRIYAIGGGSGIDHTSQVEEYDPSTDTWTVKAPMPTGRDALALTDSSDGKIYAIGGLGGENIVEAYTISDWGVQNISYNPQWLDETHFQVSYDFTSIVPRGEYFVTTQGGLGSDGILTAPSEGAHFVVDYAGEISDTTPPSQPNVLAWGNGNLTQLSAQAQANDPDSLIVGYRYAIGTTPGGVEVVNWTNISKNQVTHTGLSLLPDQGYYVSFQARNEGGLWSPIGVSNPVVNGAKLNNLYLPMTLR